MKLVTVMILLVFVVGLTACGAPEAEDIPEQPGTGLPSPDVPPHAEPTPEDELPPPPPLQEETVSDEELEDLDQEVNELENLDDELGLEDLGDLEGDLDLI